MPKANDVKLTTETAVADPKTVETEAAAEENVTDAAEKTVDVAEEKAEAEKAAPAAKRGPKKGAGRKSAGKKPEKSEKAQHVYIQCAGEEFEMAAIMDKVKAATKTLRSVHEVSIYVKPEEHRAYYVAKKAKGEEVGSVEI